MTSLDDPEAIRHFQSLCDACQELTTRYHTPAELRLYSDGYLHALRSQDPLIRALSMSRAINRSLDYGSSSFSALTM